MKYNNLLIVGGTKRNIGKTSLIERIIKKFSPKYDIIAFKIKTIYPNDAFFHGKDRSPLLETESFRIVEEHSTKGIEDTNRMLNAGAEKVYKIKVKSDYIAEAFLELEKNVSKKTLIICESNSLRKYITPALYLFVKELNSDIMKPSAKKMLKFADKIITTNGKKHNINLETLKVDNMTWIISKIQKP